MLSLGNPNLSEVERNRSQGVAVLYYTDGDYRCKWFTAHWFTDDDDALWSIDAELVVEDYVPDFLDSLGVQREEPGEPQHLLYEVYWNKELVYQKQVEDYTPVLLEVEGQ